MTTPEGALVLAFPRSGTTLLRRLLDAHPKIACPPESGLFGACGRFLREEPFAGGLAFGAVSGLRLAGFAEEDVLGRLRELAFGILRDYAARLGKPMWADKTTFDTFYLDEIERLCGDRCRTVVLYRHALDSCLSVRELCDKMQTWVPELHAYARVHPRPLEAIAHAWVDVNTRLHRYAADHPVTCLPVRYERLVAEPVAELGRILAHLGAPADAAALIERTMATVEAVPGLGDWKTYSRTAIDGGSVGRWRSLDADQVARLAAIVDPAMELLGYPRVPVRAAPAIDPHRRLRLGLLAAQLKRDTQPGARPAAGP